MNIIKKECSLINIHKPKGTISDFASNFGLKLVAKPNESWPECDFVTQQDRNREAFFTGKQAPPDIKPLFFLCQINLTEAPYVPDNLKDIEIITIFINPNFIDSYPYVVRAYKSLDGLVPVSIPKECTFEEGYQISWELAEDVPMEAYEDEYCDLDDSDQAYEEFKKLEKYLEKNHRNHSKIGGYPTTIQNEIDSDLQINSTDKLGLMFGDLGILYLKRFRDNFSIKIQYH